MQLKELKSQIESNSFLLPLVFISDNNLLVKQYIKHIANLQNLCIKRINSISEIQESLFDDNNLYVLEIEEFNEKISGNVIVICKKTDQEAIKFLKLEGWQVSDYFKLKLKGVDQYKLDEVVDKYTDYISCDIELQKIEIFPSIMQNEVFNLLYNKGYFNKEVSIFDLSNAIIKKDKKQIVEILKQKPIINEMALHSILYNNFKNILQIQTNSKCNAQSLGISDKQFYVMKKYNCGYYSTEELYNILEFLSGFEYDLKFSGILKDKILDYLLVMLN
jgi:hypothetical protein